MIGRNIQEETFLRPLRPLKLKNLCSFEILGNTNPGTQHDLQRDLNYPAKSVVLSMPSSHQDSQTLSTKLANLSAIL